MEDDAAGTVTHYFARPQVGAVKLDTEIRVGDLLRFQGSTTDFEQEVESMQIDHAAVEEADPGSEVGIKVRERVRKGDRVYKLEA